MDIYDIARECSEKANKIPYPAIPPEPKYDDFDSPTKYGRATNTVRKELFFFLHHCVAHPMVYLTRGRIFAWRFHDWTGARGWPQSFNDEPVRWAGLE